MCTTTSWGTCEEFQRTGHYSPRNEVPLRSPDTTLLSFIYSWKLKDFKKCILKSLECSSANGTKLSHLASLGKSSRKRGQRDHKSWWSGTVADPKQTVFSRYNMAVTHRASTPAQACTALTWREGRREAWSHTTRWGAIGSWSLLAEADGFSLMMELLVGQPHARAGHTPKTSLASINWTWCRGRGWRWWGESSNVGGLGGKGVDSRYKRNWGMGERLHILNGWGNGRGE